MMIGLGSMMLFGGFLFILFWAIVIGGAVWLVAMLARGSQRQSAKPALTSPLRSNEAPLDIMKARYARGEITKEQFEEMKRELD